MERFRHYFHVIKKVCPISHCLCLVEEVLKSIPLESSVCVTGTVFFFNVSYIGVCATRGCNKPKDEYRKD